VSSFSIIDEGHIGVKFRLGRIVDEGLSPGWTWRAPFVTTIRQYDVRERHYLTVETVYTQDTQTVETIDITVSYQYNPAMLSHLIRNVGMENIQPMIIRPRVSSILENATGQYRAEHLVQNRAALEQRVSSELSAELLPYGIVVNRFAISDITFEEQFENVIRLKVEAEQEALRAQNETTRITEVGRQRVITAEAEANAERARVTQAAAARQTMAEAEANALLLMAEAEAKAMALKQDQLRNGGMTYVEYIKWSNWNGEWPTVMSDSGLIMDMRP
jgi:regulator of protease activity HflC (stomatin/prohibitin superfamily)